MTLAPLGKESIHYDDDDEDDDDNDDYDDDDVVLAQIPVKDDDEHGEGKGF